MQKKYLIIHGHFYQPPRENPWLEYLTEQPSATPYHDWNERIYAECYAPNSRSRLLDPFGKILEMVNNYKYISFNIGPTLWDWLEEYHNEICRFIIEADKESKKNNGYGNAIAQVYNHIIMPLATREDKITQIIWGKKHFEAKFGRPPEGMWLAETAVNEETIECLIEEDINFIILSPHQVKRVRKLGSTFWYDVSEGNIDTSIPYLIHSKNNKQIAIFFYNAQLSTEISFQHLLTNGGVCAKHIVNILNKSNKGNLISIATDGEIYGHHEAFGDMCLAYIFKKELNKHNIEITNFASYLELFSPEYEVILKTGEKGKGTSWSCSHGVGRWERDCGCHNGTNNYHQKWRKPLREAMDKLNEEVNNKYHTFLKDYTNNSNALFNDYIYIILNRSSENIDKILSKHINKTLNKEERIIILKLLEAKRNSLLAFTSCGWFFDEISGIEPIQDMKYACRAIELLKEITDTDIEDSFLEILENAISNLDNENGRTIYEKQVLP